MSSAATSASLRDRWMACNGKAGVPEDIVSRWWTAIESHYTEPQRFYHTLNHLQEMFAHVDTARKHLQQPHLVDMAVFFHDIIYEPKKADNEEQSAELFKEYAAESLVEKDKDGCQAVVDFIMATKAHQTPAHLTSDLYGDQDVHYFLDTDMAVLGRSQDLYELYASQIRQEYIHIPEDVFCQKRAQVLRKFLEVPNIYATRLFREKLEKQARQNLQMEITRLDPET